MTPIIGSGFLPHPPILIPEIGRGQEREAANTQMGFRQVVQQIVAARPEVVVLLTPHGKADDRLLKINLENRLEGNFAPFGHPELRFSFNNHLPIATGLLDASKKTFLSVAGTHLRLDHGALVPLYFLQQRFRDFSLVHLSVGWDSLTTAFDSGKALTEFLQTRRERILILASGDLSHRLKEDGPYGFHPKGPQFDEKVADAFRKNQLKKLVEIPASVSEPAGQCGLVPFVVAAGMLDDLNGQTQLYSYEGPYGVGYLCAFTGLEPRRHHSSVNLAREAIRHFLVEGKPLSFIEYQRQHPDDPFLMEAAQKKGGAFVSLHRRGELRGCIGTIEGVYRHLGQEIITNAVEAALKDPRFPPVDIEELPELDIKVDVMGELEPVQDLDELDVQKYGVVVESGYRRGLLLPALDGVETVAQQLSIARRKGGIGDDESCHIWRFRVKRYK